VPAGATAVWAAPGGGIEPGELPLAALIAGDIPDTPVMLGL
jgi:hypothetical protein